MQCYYSWIQCPAKTRPGGHHLPPPSKKQCCHTVSFFIWYASYCDLVVGWVVNSIYSFSCNLLDDERWIYSFTTECTREMIVQYGWTLSPITTVLLKLKGSTNKPSGGRATGGHELLYACTAILLGSWVHFDVEKDRRTYRSLRTVCGSLLWIRLADRQSPMHGLIDWRTWRLQCRGTSTTVSSRTQRNCHAHIRH